MSRTEHNFWLDVTIFVALLITTITGFLLWLVIPHELDNNFLRFARNAWGLSMSLRGQWVSPGSSSTLSGTGFDSRLCVDAVLAGCRKRCAPIVL